MNSILFNVAMVASMLIVIVQANDDISHCDAMSKNFAEMGMAIWPEKYEAAMEYVKNNCPSQDILRHIGYIQLAQQQFKSPANKRNYKIYSELRSEQAAWLDESEVKVSDYFYELATILDDPNTVTGEQIHYPSSAAIDSLLKEVDENNDGSLNNKGLGYFWAHSSDRGIVKFLYVMHKAGNE